MADIVTPRDLSNELVTITNDATLFEIYNPDQSRNEKVQMSTLLSYVAASELVTLIILGETILARDGGNVGIGTATPTTAKLVVSTPRGGAGGIEILDSTDSDNVRYDIRMDSAGNAFFAMSDASENAKVQIWAAGDSYFNSGKVSIGTSSPATSALLDLTSTIGALLVTRMTTAQRDALTAINGMIIYNSDTPAFNFRENGSWVVGSGLA